MRLALIIAISAFCANAHAQEQVQSGSQSQSIYRSVMPDGRIIFGDKPAPGAKESKPVVLRPSNTSTPGPTSSPSGGSKPAAAGAPGRQQLIDAANADLLEARKNLEQARATLEANREPKPDEQMGTTKSGKGGSGGMRTTDAYDQRIKALEQDVATAQRQLDEAQARRNEAR